MTEYEKRKVAEAIRMLIDDDMKVYKKGLIILSKLIGYNKTKRTLEWPGDMPSKEEVRRNK